MKENVIKILKVKPHEHPEVCMLENTLETMQEAVGGYIDIIGLNGLAFLSNPRSAEIFWLKELTSK